MPPHSTMDHFFTCLMFLLSQYIATQINFETCVFKDQNMYVVGIGNVMLVGAACFSVSVTEWKQ